MPRISMSSENAAFPLTSFSASTLISGFPTTFISGTSGDGMTRGTAGEMPGAVGLGS
ncbi:unannotated protein [freshwater metagenome]|uniref:Unannotated protein n=1 Tax=freshwater metagenome TaxID=449393 RepID=A0A6J7A0N0_9ZZZZ